MAAVLGDMNMPIGKPSKKMMAKDDGGQELFISAEMSQYWSFDV